MSSYGVAILIVIELYKKWRDPWYEPSGPIIFDIVKSAFLQKNILSMSGDERSEHLYRQWIKSSRNLYGADSFYRVDNVLNLADLLVRQMRLPEAEAWYKYAHKLTAHNFGEKDKRLAPVLEKLSDLHLRAGRYDTALGFVDSALACLEQLEVGADASTNSVEDDLSLRLLLLRAEICLRSGRNEAAVANRVKRINLLLDRAPPDSVLETEARSLTAFAFSAGDTETAALYQRYVNCLSALSVAEAALGHDSAYLANDLTNLAHFYRHPAMNRPELAQRLSRRAHMLRLWQRVNGADYRGIEHDLASVATWLKERNSAADLTVAFHLEQRIKRIAEKRNSKK